MNVEDFFKKIADDRVKNGAWEPFELRGYTLSIIRNASQPFFGGMISKKQGGRLKEGIDELREEQGLEPTPDNAMQGWCNPFRKIGDIDFICLN
jgi:hypothetical protein